MSSEEKRLRQELYARPAPEALSRRAFNARLGSAIGALGALGWPANLVAQALGAREALPAWVADLDGDGVVTEADARLLRRALNSQRGFDLDPLTPYDHRADLFGRGRVGQRDLLAFEQLRGSQRVADQVPPRPVTVAWHYTWYHNRHRLNQTAEFLGGNYLSKDPATEELFNRLKNELGITVDALSWISPRFDGRPLRNANRGYFKAANADTRHLALLYESTLSLPRDGERIDFVSTDVRGNLVEDFRLMGGYLRNRTRHSGARVFRLDRRPVIFVYGSHTWVTNVRSDFQFAAMDTAIEEATDAFKRAFGERPFLVGEEIPLAPEDAFSEDRVRRSRNFDAMFVYHHAASPMNIIAGGDRLDSAYALHRQELLDRTVEAISELRNRFTGQPVLIIPSLAAGFAKKGTRKLWTGRASYARFLDEMTSYYESSYLPNAELPRRYVPAPVYTLGSWNEEFEGHCLFPFSWNRSVPDVSQGGFDLGFAVKEIFGWNHYATRAIGL